MNRDIQNVRRKAQKANALLANRFPPHVLQSENKNEKSTVVKML